MQYDGCYAPNLSRRGALADYGTMRDALAATGRPILFSACGWNAWYAPRGGALAHSWRIAPDCDEVEGEKREKREKRGRRGREEGEEGEKEKREKGAGW